jgi:hypothetical protein
MSVFEMSRSRVSTKSMSKQIETPRIKTFELQWAPLDGITDNATNQLIESTFSRFTSPKLLLSINLNEEIKHLGLGVSTVKSNRDRDQDVSTCRDVFFQTVEIFSTVEMSVFEMSRSRVSIKISTKIEISRHCRVIDTVKTWVLKCRDFLDS